MEVQAYCYIFLAVWTAVILTHGIMKLKIVELEQNPLYELVSIPADYKVFVAKQEVNFYMLHSQGMSRCVEMSKRVLAEELMHKAVIPNMEIETIVHPTGALINARLTVAAVDNLRGKTKQMLYRKFGGEFSEQYKQDYYGK